MAASKEEKLAAKAQLRLGSTPKEVATKTGISLATVYSWAQQVKAEEMSDMQVELATIPPETIHHIIEEAKEKELIMPSPAGKAMVADMQAVAVGVDGLKKLDGAFQTTMTNVLKRFDTMLQDENLPLKDVKIIADTAASAYEKIFTSGTNIHIGDNNSQSNAQLTIFKNKQGV